MVILILKKLSWVFENLKKINLGSGYTKCVSLPLGLKNIGIKNEKKYCKIYKQSKYK